MLILQIILGWLAISSVCLNVYLFFTLSRQRELNQEYRELLHHADKQMTEHSIEISTMFDRWRSLDHRISNAEWKIENPVKP
jgi:hypothetical protein